MNLWTVMFAVVAVSNEYVNTYRVFDFDGVLMPYVSNPITLRAGYQRPWPRPLCLINNIWVECPVVPRVSKNNEFTGSQATENYSLRPHQFLQKSDQSTLRPFKSAVPYLYQSIAKYLNRRFLKNPSSTVRAQNPRRTFPYLINPALINNMSGNWNMNLRRKLDKMISSENLSSNALLNLVRFGNVTNNLYNNISNANGTPSNVNSFKKQKMYPELGSVFRENVTLTEKPTDVFPNTSNIPVTNDKVENTGEREKTLSNTDLITTQQIEQTILKSTTNIIEEQLTTPCPLSVDNQRKMKLLDTFLEAVDQVDRKFYNTTFSKLTMISPEERRENGISFAQSGLFLSLLLLAISTETSEEAKAEIHQCLQLNITDAEKIEVIELMLSELPVSNDELKFRWASRLVLGPRHPVSGAFRAGAAAALRLNLHELSGNETDADLADTLNLMVETDSGGAIHETFEPDEVTGGVRGVAMTTLYMRASWRAAPTVLNGTRPFHDGISPTRTARMIRVNDIMRYASVDDWHFEALEISYSTPGLTLLMLIPRGRSLRALAARVATTSMAALTRHMDTMRVAATLPLYTLRMTLLLPSKLRTMGITSLMSDANATDDGKLKLSHAIQRLMFWSEAGRNAFKDDGIEWDEPPELELVVDRPYLYFVRWHNITLMSGNFVL